MPYLRAGQIVEPHPFSGIRAVVLRAWLENQQTTKYPVGYFWGAVHGPVFEGRMWHEIAEVRYLHNGKIFKFYRCSMETFDAVC